MIKFLGVFDIFAAGLLVGAGYHLPMPQGLIITVAIYLLLKALIFLMDIGSLFDIIGGILLILSLSMSLPPIVFFIFAALVGLKGIMSLFA